MLCPRSRPRADPTQVRRKADSLVRVEECPDLRRSVCQGMRMKRTAWEYTRVQQVLKDLNTLAWVWRTASPAQTDLPGLHLIRSDSGMPELVRPTLEVHRSFLAAMAEFRGEGAAVWTTTP